MLNAYAVKATEPEVVEAIVVFQGNTTSNPTKTYGAGCTVTRSAEGKVALTWSDHQGTFMGAVVSVGDTTPSNVAGFTIHYDANSYTASTKALDLWVYDASQTLADLATTSYVTVKVLFKRVGV